MLWLKLFLRADVSSFNFSDCKIHECVFGYVGAGLGQLFGRKDVGACCLKLDVGSDEAHEFGAGIGVECDVFLYVFGFGNPFDDICNMQGGLVDCGW